MYFEGEGVVKDDEEAVKWYRKANRVRICAKKLGRTLRRGQWGPRLYYRVCVGYHFSSQWGQNCFKNEFATRKENDPRTNRQSPRTRQRDDKKESEAD